MNIPLAAHFKPHVDYSIKNIYSNGIYEVDQMTKKPRNPTKKVNKRAVGVLSDKSAEDGLLLGELPATLEEVAVEDPAADPAAPGKE